MPRGQAATTRSYRYRDDSAAGRTSGSRRAGRGLRRSPSPSRAHIGEGHEGGVPRDVGKLLRLRCERRTEERLVRRDKPGPTPEISTKRRRSRGEVSRACVHLYGSPRTRAVRPPGARREHTPMIARNQPTLIQATACAEADCSSDTTVGSMACGTRDGVIGHGELRMYPGTRMRSLHPNAKRGRQQGVRMDEPSTLQRPRREAERHDAEVSSSWGTRGISQNGPGRLATSRPQGHQRRTREEAGTFDQDCAADRG